ncbi:jg2110, partial [Pararge aegeria aegeria]
FERHAVLPKFLGMRVEAWMQESCMYNMDSNAIGSARRSLPTGTIDAYSLLASFGGRRLTPRGPYIHYTEDAYSKIGRALAKALCDYYRHIGVIPPREGISTKKKESRRKRRRRPVYERERSPSSSPERRVLAARVLSPPLPVASPPALRSFPSRTARNLAQKSRPRTVYISDNVLPIITGKAVRTPRLAVVDLSAYIRTPASFPRHGARQPKLRTSRTQRPPQVRHTSEEYDTHDSDS